VNSPFAAILKRAVDRVPGAVGAIFAAWDGEEVDHVASMSREEMRFFGAHLGIVLNHVQSALHLFHFGEAREMVLQHDQMDLLVHAVGDGYYLLLAVRGGVHLATAQREVQSAADALRQEMY
jgi:predicted regulator of Ras-like GTPase activity (Roadblock/LC7/MglB family)